MEDEQKQNAFDDVKWEDILIDGEKLVIQDELMLIFYNLINSMCFVPNLFRPSKCPLCQILDNNITEY
jgi:hypothetical protein